MLLLVPGRVRSCPIAFLVVLLWGPFWYPAGGRRYSRAASVSARQLCL